MILNIRHTNFKINNLLLNLFKTCQDLIQLWFKHCAPHVDNKHMNLLYLQADAGVTAILLQTEAAPTQNFLYRPTDKHRLFQHNKQVFLVRTRGHVDL